MDSTLEAARARVGEFVGEFGVDAGNFPEAVIQLARLCECEDVARLFQRLSLQCSSDALCGTEKNLAMMMGMAHLFNVLSSVLSPKI